MTQEAIQAQIESLDPVAAKITTPQAARQFLIAAGILQPASDKSPHTRKKTPHPLKNKRANPYLHPMENQPTLEELRQYFATAPLPPVPFQLYQGTQITDMRGFIDGQFSVIDAGTSQAAIKPCHDRLVDLYKLLTSNKK